MGNSGSAPEVEAPRPPSPRLSLEKLQPRWEQLSREEFLRKVEEGKITIDMKVPGPLVLTKTLSGALSTSSLFSLVLRIEKDGLMYTGYLPMCNSHEFKWISRAYFNGTENCVIVESSIRRGVSELRCPLPELIELQVIVTPEALEEVIRRACLKIESGEGPFIFSEDDVYQPLQQRITDLTYLEEMINQRLQSKGKKIHIVGHNVTVE